MNPEYDLVVIGGGAAGYSAALKASDTMKVAIIEKDEMGGVCLNRGCIPTKRLRWIANRYGVVDPIESLRKLRGKEELDAETLERLIKESIDTMQEGLISAIRSAGIDIIRGKAISSKKRDEVEVLMDGELITIKYRWLLIATGAQPIIPEICDPLINKDISGRNIFTSDSAFKRENLKLTKILIIGGGVIGAEFASIYADLGVEVILVESRDRILNDFSEDISKIAAKILRRKGVKVLAGYSVLDIIEEGNESIVTLEDCACKKEEVLVDRILVATGRKPVIDKKLLDDLGVNYENNMIVVDKYNKTSQNNIFAAGDVCCKVQLAYIASNQAEHIIYHINNLSMSNVLGLEENEHDICNNYASIPKCVFLDPEVVQVGMCDGQASREEYMVSKFSLKGNGMAVLQNKSEGYVKLVAEKRTGKIVGVELVCPDAVEISSLCRAWIEKEKTGLEIANEIFPHPSITEALKEAAKRLL